MRTRNILALLLAVLLIASLAGCVSNGAETPVDTGQQQTNDSDPKVSADDGTTQTGNKAVELLRIGTTAPCENFSNFAESGSYGRMNIYSTVQMPFWRVDKDSQVISGFIEEWEISEDNMEMTIKFPTNAMWHDGKPVTAEDVKFTFDYHMEVIKNDYTSQLASADIISDNTVKLVFLEPAAFALLYKCADFVYPVPKHIWEGIEEPRTYFDEGALISCGPYTVTNIDQDAQTFTMEAVPEHYLGEVNVKKIVVKSYDTQESLVLALKNKEIDCFSDYSKSLVSTLAPSITDVEGLELGTSVNPGNMQLQFGASAAPSNEKSFRNAVSYALNHELIAATVGGEYGEIPGRGVIAPPNKGFDASIAKLSYDLEKANSILDDAGYTDTNGDDIREGLDGNPMEVLLTLQWNPAKKELLVRLGEIIQTNLKDVGIRVIIDEESLSNQDAYKKLVNTDRAYQMFIVNNTTGIALYKTSFFYMQRKYGMFGTWETPELAALYEEMMCAPSFEVYSGKSAEIQRYNDEHTLGIALGWDHVFFPYWTDQYDGWTNFPGVGGVNYKTWYELYTK